jgi:hypothetical protein
MKLAHASQLTLLAASMFLLSGCITKQLWEQKAFCEPASPPNLQLSFDGRRKDVLVQYDEISERSYRTRHRAYFLYKNLKRLENRHKPRFASPVPNLKPLQILAAEPSSGMFLNQELYAISATNSASFALYSNGRELGTYELPVYRDGVQLAGQIGLTPVAVTADVLIVGTVVGVILWAESGFYPLSEQSRGHP